MNLYPINKWMYSQYGDEKIVSEERFSDSARVMFIVMYRLRLISDTTIANYVVLKRPLREFGNHWFNLYIKDFRYKDSRRTV